MVMDIFTALFSNTLVAFILLVGVVVFVHEAGHFIAGRLCGVQIEEFAIGFGPQAFSFHRNGTAYRINWLPLGGYVRFYGAATDETIPTHLQAKSIQHAPVFKRAIISFAGPFANFLLSFCILMILFFHGIPKRAAIVSVVPHSIAEQAGMLTGDKILSINGRPIHYWNDLSEVIAASPAKPLELTVENQGQKRQLHITPSAEDSETILGKKQKAGRIGISPLFQSPDVFILKYSLLDAWGMETGDKVISINNTPIQFLFQIEKKLEEVTGSHSSLEVAEKILKKNPFPGGDLWQAEVLRHGKKITLHFQPSSQEAYQYAQTTLKTFKEMQKYPDKNKDFLLKPEPWKNELLSMDHVLQTPKNLTKSQQANLSTALSAWQECQLHPGDLIYEISGIGRIFSNVQILSWLDNFSLQLISSSTESPTTKHPSPSHVQMTLLSPTGQLKSVECHVPPTRGWDHLNRPKLYLEFPYTFASHGATMPPVMERSPLSMELIAKAISHVGSQISMTYEGILMILTGSIPLSNLGGPISIAGAAGDAAREGWMTFLFMMSFLSTNIGMMNLLPLPALDGGALLLHGVEAAWGKPLPDRVRAGIQRIGIFVILILFVVVFYNDIIRILR